VSKNVKTVKNLHSKKRFVMPSAHLLDIRDKIFVSYRKNFSYKLAQEVFPYCKKKNIATRKKMFRHYIKKTLIFLASKIIFEGVFPGLKYPCNVQGNIHARESIHLKILEWTFMVHGYSRHEYPCEYFQ